MKNYEWLSRLQMDIWGLEVAGLAVALNSVEVSCTIIGVSLPFIRPLILRLKEGEENFRKEKDVARSGRGSQNQRGKGKASCCWSSSDDSRESYYDEDTQHIMSRIDESQFGILDVEGGRQHPGYSR